MPRSLVHKRRIERVLLTDIELPRDRRTVGRLPALEVTER